MIPLSTNTWPRHFEKIFEQKPRASTGAGDCCSLTNRGDIKGQKVKVERLPLPKIVIFPEVSAAWGSKAFQGIAVHQISTDEALLD